MRAFQLSKSLSGIAALLVLALILNATTRPARASQNSITAALAIPTALAQSNPDDVVLAVHPTMGKAGQPRTVILRFNQPSCVAYTFTFDKSSMDSDNLVVLRTQKVGQLCPATHPPPSVVIYALEFTPAKVGSLTLRWDEGGFQTTIETSAASATSKFDANGMWFDAATNGSGIAMHHGRATTDAAFGTWFLYSKEGDARWFTLQSTNWLQDGSVLEGLLYQTVGLCQKANLVACPAAGEIQGPIQPNTIRIIPSRARITFQSSTRAHAEVSTLGGTVLFTSELTKLQF